jgi:nitrate reductase NapE
VWQAQELFDFDGGDRFMSDTLDKNDARPDGARRFGRRAELIVFAVIAAFIWPVVAVGVVGGYGFLVWMSQLILGPPGPPGA